MKTRLSPVEWALLVLLAVIAFIGLFECTPARASTDPVADTRQIMAGTVTTKSVKSAYLSGARDSTAAFQGALSAYKAVRAAEQPTPSPTPAPTPSPPPPTSGLLTATKSCSSLWRNVRTDAAGAVLPTVVVGQQYQVIAEPAGQQGGLVPNSYSAAFVIATPVGGQDISRTGDYEFDPGCFLPPAAAAKRS